MIPFHMLFVWVKHQIVSINVHDLSQQAFILMKTSFVFIKTSSRRIDQAEYLCLSLTSSEDVFKTNIFVLAIRLQDVFKTFSRRLQDVFKTSCQCVFKMFSRRLPDVLHKRLQGMFKTSSSRFEDVFKTSSRHFEKRL